MSSRRVAALAAVIAIVPIMLAGCSSSDDSDASASTTTAAEAAGTTVPMDTVLDILVTNDDGVTSDGISTVTEALRALPDVKVTVVAPAAQQSGQGGKETGGTLVAQA